MVKRYDVDGDGCIQKGEGMTDISKESLHDALYLLECGDQNDNLKDLQDFIRAQAANDHHRAQVLGALGL